MIRPRGKRTVVVIAILVVTGMAATACSGQSTPKDAPAPEESEGQDDNPTKVVLWSVRNEYFNLPGHGMRDVLLIRGDKAIFKKKPQLPGRRGLILRLDIPFAFINAGSTSGAGLGNIYVQAVSVPHLTRTFAFALGTGLTLPTNSDNTLGSDKWVAAPLVVPIWFTRQKGFFLIKAQGFISFAGPGPGVHVLKVQPNYMVPLKGRWWIQFDTESTTSFDFSGHTGFTSGLRFGKLMTRHLAMWVEPRVGWGRYRESDFGLKSSLYWVR